MSDIILSAEEVAEFCAPLRRPADQFKKLQALGIRCWLNTYPRAAVVVPRGAFEAWKNPVSVSPPVPLEVVMPRHWEDTPLGRWHAENRVARREWAAQEAAIKAEDDARWEASRPKREEASRLQRAALVRFHANRRRVLKLQRSPAWADQDAMRAIYLEAQRLTRDTGQAHHVDHIIPLQGRLVSGLHVAGNLQILTASENSRKRNHYEVEA